MRSLLPEKPGLEETLGKFGPSTDDGDGGLTPGSNRVKHIPYRSDALKADFPGSRKGRQPVVPSRPSQHERLKTGCFGTLELTTRRRHLATCYRTTGRRSVACPDLARAVFRGSTKCAVQAVQLDRRVAASTVSECAATDPGALAPAEPSNREASAELLLPALWLR